MSNYFADLHCHPTFRPFNTLRNTDVEFGDRFHPWNIKESNLKKQKAGRRAAHYTESDFIKAFDGNVKLCFASLYPIEKGFFLGKDGTDADKKNIIDISNVLGGGLVQSIVSFVLNSFVKKAIQLILGQKHTRNFFQRLVMNFSKERIQYIQSEKYDYWNELVLEHEFIKNKDGVEFYYKDTVGKYYVVRNVKQLKNLTNMKSVNCILTIEGMHALSIGYDMKPVPSAILEKRIEVVRSWGVFFITFAHHFDNGLCGHAHSLTDELSIIMNQCPGLNEGFRRDGWTAARNLLGLDEQLNVTGKRRILIDLKHMSAHSRKEFYDMLIIPYNNRNPQNKIPVIASHCGYSGYFSLLELIGNATSENNKSDRNGFYPWNINLCDEDVCIIHESEGLIGICFDQRILGDDKKDKSDRKKDGYWINLVVRNILAMVDAVIKEGKPNPEKIWERFAIGTDFEGMIDPLDDFPTDLEFGKFKEALRERLSSENRQYYMIDKVGLDRIVDNICFNNANNFVHKHFN